MAEILLCNQPTNKKVIEASHGIPASELVTTIQPANSDSLKPHHPYLIAGNPTINEKQLLAQLGTGETARNLTRLSLTYGPENTIALASMMHDLKEHWEKNEIAIGATGTSLDAVSVRGEKFVHAVEKYQKALLSYRDAINTNPSGRLLARQRVVRAFTELQRKFGNELKFATRGIKARKGLALTDMERGINIAKSSRNVTKLNLSSQIEASRVIKFAKTTKILSNGLTVVDFGVRASSVYNSYESGKNWERKLFVESSSFALGTEAGSIALDAGLGLLLMLTPIGWVGLIVGGVIVVGAAAYTGYEVNKITKEKSGPFYDYIMKNIGY